MSTPFYDTQKILESAGLSQAHIPGDVERQKAYDETKGDPIGRKDPNAVGPLGGLSLQERGQAAQKSARRDYENGSLFFRRQGQGIRTSLGIINFDLILDEEVTLTAQVCQHPVQSGDPITDHIQPLPMHGRLKILVSEHSLKYANGGVKQGQGDPGESRALTAYEMFKSIMQARVPVTLVTVLEAYSVNTVVLTKVSVPRSFENGDSLTFDIEYTQIKVIDKLRATSLNVTAKPVNMTTPKNQSAAPNVNTGNQSPTEKSFPPDGVIEQ